MNRLLKKIQSTIAFKSIRILGNGEKRRLVLVVIFQIFLGLFDLLGILLIGVLGALTVNGIQSKAPGNRVLDFLKFMRIDNLNFQMQVTVIGLSAGFLLVFKTICSIVITRKVLYFMSSRSAMASANLTNRLLQLNITQINQLTNQQNLFSLTSGVSAITMGIIATTINMISDLSLLLILAGGLFFVNSIIAFCTFSFFGLIGYLLYRLMHKRAHYLGVESSNLNVFSNERILEVLQSFREIYVRNRREYYANIIAKSRMDIARNSAEISFQPNIGKYVIETGLVVGSLLVCAIQFGLQDAAHAIATLTIFLAAGTRIAPAVLRIQQGLIAIKNSIGAATPTLELMDKLATVSLKHQVNSVLNLNHVGFTPTVSVNNVSFTYENSNIKALDGISLEIKEGSFIAFVGPSGAGKSTLVDVILGILKPNTGEVKISNVKPDDAIANWSGAIAYVPQDIMLINGTVRDNIALGYARNEFEDSQVWRSLEQANLLDFIGKSDLGLDTLVGERGARLSGGQKQRLGIARALFTKPKLIILDEATSALDSQTEHEITETITKLKGQVTFVVIAHRLSTISNSDKLYYLENGKIESEGTFSQVKQSVPNFAIQAKLSGM